MNQLRDQQEITDIQAGLDHMERSNESWLESCRSLTVEKIQAFDSQELKGIIETLVAIANKNIRRRQAMEVRLLELGEKPPWMYIEK